MSRIYFWKRIENVEDSLAGYTR